MRLTYFQFSSACGLVTPFVTLLMVGSLYVDPSTWTIRYTQARSVPYLRRPQHAPFAVRAPASLRKLLTPVLGLRNANFATAVRSPIGLAVVRCKLFTGPHVGAGQRHLHVESKRPEAGGRLLR